MKFLALFSLYIQLRLVHSGESMVVIADNTFALRAVLAKESFNWQLHRDNPCRDRRVWLIPQSRSVDLR